MIKFFSIANKYRQACAIESAALQNPHRDIFVIFAAPLGTVESQALPLYIDTLLTQRNIYFRIVDLMRYLNGTPISKWIESNRNLESIFLFQHLDDILPLVTLQKFGGFHVSLDVVVQKGFDELGTNFIGDSWADVVSTNLMHFSRIGVGREVMKRFFR